MGVSFIKGNVMCYLLPRKIMWGYRLCFLITTLLYNGFVTAETFLNQDKSRGDLIDKEGYDLSRLINFGLENSPDIIISDYEIQAAKAKEDAAYGSMLPQISIESSYTKYSDNQRLGAATYNGELGVFGDRLMAGDLVMKVPLYTGGRMTRARS